MMKVWHKGIERTPNMVVLRADGCGYALIRSVTTMTWEWWQVKDTSGQLVTTDRRVDKAEVVQDIRG